MVDNVRYLHKIPSTLPDVFLFAKYCCVGIKYHHSNQDISFDVQYSTNKYGCRCKASIVKRRGQVIYELVREPDV